MEKILYIRYSLYLVSYDFFPTLVTKESTSHHSWSVENFVSLVPRKAFATLVANGSTFISAELGHFAALMRKKT